MTHEKKCFVVQRAAGDAMLQCGSIQERRDDKGQFAASSDLADGADVGVIGRRSCSGLAAEMFQYLRISSQLFRQDSECHKAAKLEVLGLVNQVHASTPEFLEDRVVGDDLIDHGDAIS